VAVCFKVTWLEIARVGRRSSASGGSGRSGMIVLSERNATRQPPGTATPDKSPGPSCARAPQRTRPPRAIPARWAIPTRDHHSGRRNPPRKPPNSSDTRSSTSATKNIILARPTAAPAIPPNPSQRDDQERDGEMQHVRSPSLDPCRSRIVRQPNNNEQCALAVPRRADLGLPCPGSIIEGANGTKSRN
jgi:hypothetical protein